MSITSPTEDGPTVVLVHGAFIDSCCWNGVVAGLLEKDRPVIAAANPLRGVRRDADRLRGLLDAVGGDVVLVGHSYGGTVITHGATGDDRVKALVYVSGFAAEAGETTAGLATRKGNWLLDEALVRVGPAGGGEELYIRRDHYRARVAADSPARDAAVMAATQRPLAVSMAGCPC